MSPVLLAALLAHVAASPVALSESTVEGVPVRAIRVDLNDPRVRVNVIVAANFPGTDESFASMLAAFKPYAAVNGAYFSKDTLKPIGDIVIDGVLVTTGRMGTAFTIADDGRVDILRVVRHKTMDWSGRRVVLACGPALVLEGEIDVRYEEEGFRDPHVTGRAQRMSLGYTSANKLVLAHIRKPVTFHEQARIMKAMGCFEAMNLDAGASLAMAYNGKVLHAPGRKLTNILAVWKD